MELNIRQGEGIPANPQGRNAEPNPFDGMFPTAENKTLIVELPGEGDKHDAQVNKVRAFARKAAAKCDPPMTARVHAEPYKDDKGNAYKGKNAGTVLTIWTRNKVTKQTTATEDGGKAAADAVEGTA